MKYSMYSSAQFELVNKADFPQSVLLAKYFYFITIIDRYILLEIYSNESHLSRGHMLLRSMFDNL